MLCPKCSYENPDNALFCGLCKEVLVRKNQPQPEEVYKKKEVNYIPEEKKQNKTSASFRIITSVIIAIILGLFVKSFVITRIYIASSSMEPALKVNQRFWVNMLVYKFIKPKTYDLIVFTSPVENISEVKRVIAVAGEKVQIINKEVFINDTRLYEPYVYRQNQYETYEDDNFGPFYIPKGRLFVLGDNRDASKDSRNWKFASTGKPAPLLPESNVVGRLIYTENYKFPPKSIPKSKG